MSHSREPDVLVDELLHDVRVGFGEESPIATVGTVHGHLFRGLFTLTEDGVDDSAVYFTCEDVDCFPPEQLTKLSECATPPLTVCGRHDIEGC